MKINNKILIMALLLATQAAHADLLGVADVELIATSLKQLSVLRDQYQLLQDSQQQAKNQLESINSLRNMNSGHYGFGELSNGLDTLQSWQSPASTWQDALQNLSGGNPSRYQALVDAYEKNHPALNEAAYARDTTPENAARFKEDKAVNRAVQVQTADSYNEINQHMGTLHKLSKQIEKTSNTKGAIDLNSRLALVKDKLLLVGVVVVCVLIGVSNLLPKHKSNITTTQDEKQDARSALNQNMELIAKLQDNQNRIKTGYQGATPNHPPQLRSAHDGTLSKETVARMNAPSTFFSVSGGETQAVGAKDAQRKTLIGHDANSEFLNQQNDIASVSAKQLPYPGLTVPAGEMIPATMETAINSELAGMARAITTRDIYALSGNKLLIPKGSTLVGQFNATITQGQSRIFVVWDRMQMTNGIIVTLNSPSTDAIGRSGQAADYIDRHFVERFGSGALLSVLGAYTATGGVNGQDEYNSMSQYRMNIAGGFQQAANQTLQQDMQVKPTLQINQGASINVFVAHDLDFYRVARRI